MQIICDMQQNLNSSPLPYGCFLELRYIAFQSAFGPLQAQPKRQLVPRLEGSSFFTTCNKIHEFISFSQIDSFYQSVSEDLSPDLELTKITSHGIPPRTHAQASNFVPISYLGKIRSRSSRATCNKTWRFTSQANVSYFCQSVSGNLSWVHENLNATSRLEPSLKPQASSYSILGRLGGRSFKFRRATNLQTSLLLHFIYQ